jgi:hypothetical protein
VFRRHRLWYAGAVSDCENKKKTPNLLDFDMRILSNRLKLVYPPISNQEGDWLVKLPEVREFVGHSKLYMIGQRPELKFGDFEANEESNILSFSLSQETSDIEASVQMPIDALLDGYDGDLIVELGPKLIRIRGKEQPDDEEPLLWFTPDKFLFNAWNGHMPVQGLTWHREFAEFDLLYVGISKATDSLSRLFATGHKARLSILTNESQQVRNARLTDELMIFLFDIEQTGVAVFDDLGAWPENSFPDDKLQVVADAEKAFVKLLDPRYNVQKYASYPQGADGLYGTGLTSYSYHIGEDITFRTPNGTFWGSVDESTGHMITVSGDEVSIVDLGKPFEGEER